MKEVEDQTVQTKLAISTPGDPLESEADRIADAVVGTADQGTSMEAMLDAAGPPLAVVEDSDDHEMVQRFVEPTRDAVSGHYEHAVRGARTGGRRLSEAELSFMESRFGVDFSKVRIHDDARAATAAEAISARAFTRGTDVVFGAGQHIEGTTASRWLLAHELAHVVQQQRGGKSGRDGLLQRKPEKTKALVFQFTVTPVTATDAHGFRILVCTQILGVDSTTAAEYAVRFRWSGPHSTNGVSPTDVGKPLVISIDASIYRSVKGSPRTQGEGTDPSGRGADFAARVAEFDGLPSAEKTSMNEEVDRRFWSRTGYKPGKKLGQSSADRQMAQLWLDIRDEVMVQRRVLQRLEPSVQQVLGGAVSFKPKDYPQLVRIASKLSPTEWVDYIARIRAQATNLDQLEASVDAYLVEKRKRDADVARLKQLQIKLAGTEGLYRAYKDYLQKREAAAGTVADLEFPVYIPPTQAEIDAADAAQKSLTAGLLAADFKGGIPEFESSLRDYVSAFEAQAVNIGITALDNYEGFLYRQRQLYQDDAVISALYDSLAPLRTAYREFDVQKRIMEESNEAYQRQREESRLPGSGHIRPDPALKERADVAQAQAEAQKERAISVTEGISGSHPIFKEENLPIGRRIPKEKLAQADKAGIKSILAQHIADRTEDVRDTRANLRSDPEIIYKMDQLMGEALRQLEVTPGSIFEELVQDKAKRIQREETLVAILVGVLALAFSILTFGTGTIAAIGALGALGVGGLVAYGEFEKFRIASAAAGSGLSSDEPSPVWLVLAVVGVVIDAAVALKAVRALGPAAKALEAGGELDAFRKAVQALEKQGQIDSKLARSVEAAAEARKAYEAAAKELSIALRSKAYSFPGPLADPDVYKAVVKMAAAKVRQGVQSIQQFILELNKIRIDAKLAELSGEELALAKQAYLEGSEATKIGTYSTRIQWGIHSVEARPFGPGFWGKRTIQGNARVNAYELKINPNNESFFLPHPDGGFVQFETVVATTVRDGKLVMSTRSIYHVAEMPGFARIQVLAEARRQLAAAKQAGFTVEWLVSDQKAITQLGDLFQAENISITLKLLPE